ncbi:MAG: translation initiation factor IF-2 [Alphaproteobacteria bacterium]|nr:MAG: translation initiation factor IF-2 [Alphaproteobacteria bacterium]
MTDTKNTKSQKLSLGGDALKRIRDQQQKAPGGRSTVTVEVRRRRMPGDSHQGMQQGRIPSTLTIKKSQAHEEVETSTQASDRPEKRTFPAGNDRLNAIREALSSQNSGVQTPRMFGDDLLRDNLSRLDEDARRRKEIELRQKAEADSAARKRDERNDRDTDKSAVYAAAPVSKNAFSPRDDERRHHHAKTSSDTHTHRTANADDTESIRNKAKTAPQARISDGSRRNTGRISVRQAMDITEDVDHQRTRSMASIRRAREKERKRQMQADTKKVVREVTIPEVITVQELANRMAERVAIVIKTLLSLDVMVTANQTIDADTAELVVTELGHKHRRVSESDVEHDDLSAQDSADTMIARCPVVTIMGHVDHGKTSLLDAIRNTDVAEGEAGKITQHIGAYQVQTKKGQRITFIDTPGHAAFNQMRARGANVTDIVVLVVAANDSVKDQTVEAIQHAKAAGVPIIVAVNKIDLPDADSMKVKTDLLQHEVIVEDMSGDVQCVEVSAKAGLGLDKLEEAILLQAEMMDLKANANRPANGVVIESRMEIGQGPVATVLIQGGTLKMGDIFIAGTEYGRVRLLKNERNARLVTAEPSTPVEVVGFNGSPAAGDEFAVVSSDNQAREIAEYRQRKTREAQVLAARKTMDQLFSENALGKELAVVVKADVQGSQEAICGSLAKIGTDEVSVRVVGTGVGGINESDISLAMATKARVLGFNVRANAQAKDLAHKEGIAIKYYSVIYDIIDDIKAILSGMLAPTIRETFCGTAEVMQVIKVTKVGKIAGCVVRDGSIKRGAKVRLLRKDVIIHEGALKTLRRFKDEVQSVNNGLECGIAFDNFQDMRVGDIIECFEVTEIARKL